MSQTSGNRDFDFSTPTTTPTPDRTPSQSVLTLACCLSGALIGAVVGGLGVGLLSGNGAAALAGVVGGLILGALILRRIASFESVLGGAAFGAFLPFGLILLHLLRSGRIADVRAEDFASPMFLVVAGILLVAGGLLGAALVAVRKLIVWMLCGA
jgi:hypothetical protein